MSEKQQLLDELQKIYEGDAWHGNSLGEILSGITAAKAVARPIAGAHSIWEIALHIAAWNETFTERLSGGVRPEPIDGDFPFIPDTSDEAWRRTLQRVKASQEKLIEVVGNLDEESFSKQFANRDYSLSFFLHGIVRHVVYHSGQIAMLKKA
ncbi:MAG: DinB family protein [Pyrinomonadaceae bacterium]